MPCKEGEFVVTAQTIPKLRTPGVVAHELSEPLHRVLYVLRTRPCIMPSARAGRFRLYDRDAVAMIRHALNSMAARKGVARV
jgi:hypothetical protein